MPPPRRSQLQNESPAASTLTSTVPLSSQLQIVHSSVSRPAGAQTICLKLDEMLSLFAEHCGDKRTLFNMALTCTAFLEPAIRVLWAELEDIAPLLLILRDDAVERAAFNNAAHTTDSRHAEFILVSY